MDAKTRHKALVELRNVLDRLTAWRDNAELMTRSTFDDQQRWKNEYANYASCIEHLESVNRILLDQ